MLNKTHHSIWITQINKLYSQAALLLGLSIRIIKILRWYLTLQARTRLQTISRLAIYSCNQSVTPKEINRYSSRYPLNLQQEASSITSTLLSSLTQVISKTCKEVAAQTPTCKGRLLAEVEADLLKCLNTSSWMLQVSLFLPYSGLQMLPLFRIIIWTAIVDKNDSIIEEFTSATK